MKVTRHICDFNENLAQHDAELQIVIDEKYEDRRLDIDVCTKHLNKMIQSSFIDRDNARTIHVTKLSKNGNVKVATRKGVTFPKKPCPVEGCDKEVAPQGMSLHLAHAHPGFVLDKGTAS